MRVCFLFTTGKKIWSDQAHLKPDGEPIQELIIPQVVPGAGIVGRPFTYFATVHTQNENSYLTYVEKKTEATH
jgi:hypothetical protein